MKISYLVDDAMRLRFVLFALKDLAKKWLYSLAAGSITSWDGFIKVFLKKFYPIHKTALSCSSSKNLVNHFGGFFLTLQRPSCPMSLSWNREMAIMPNSLWQFRLLNQDPLRNHVQRGILGEG